MAYARKTARRSSRVRTTARAPARRSYRTSGAARRPAARGRSSSASRTIRIVVVNESASPIARPVLGMMQAATPRRPAFN